MTIRYYVTANIFGAFQVICDKDGYENYGTATLLALELSKSVPVIVEHRAINSCEDPKDFDVQYAESYDKGQKTSA